MEAKLERRMSHDLQTEVKNELKINLKDVKNIEDFDFDKVNLIRGETPPDIKEQCLKLCQDYLSGVWSEQTIDTIEVRRVSGGLTNQLYYCGLIEMVEEEKEVPQEVAVRLYGPKYFDSCDNETNERLSDVIIGLMVSQNKLGPKIYGINESGQIQKFYKHQQFREDLQNDPHLVMQVFQNLARIHCMDVPIKKNTNWMEKTMVNNYNEAFEKFPLSKEFEEHNCVTFMSNNIKVEMDWANQVVKQAHSPLVFNHNDFRSSNLMITEPNNELVVCDFEYGGYGPRGGDFVNMMREWGRNPFDIKSMGELPEDSAFKPLIAIYVDECVKIKGKSYSENPINSVDHILREVKIHLLRVTLFFTILLLKNDDTKNEIPMARNVTIGFAEMCLKSYYVIKKKLIEENIIF